MHATRKKNPPTFVFFFPVTAQLESVIHSSEYRGHWDSGVGTPHLGALQQPLIHHPMLRILLHIRRETHTLPPLIPTTPVEMHTNVREAASDVVGEGLRVHPRLQAAKLCCEFLSLTFVALTHLDILRLYSTPRGGHGELVDAMCVHGLASRGPRHLSRLYVYVCCTCRTIFIKGCCKTPKWGVPTPESQ